jgi:cysteine-rich repeat protein
VVPGDSALFIHYPNNYYSANAAGGPSNMAPGLTPCDKAKMKSTVEEDPGDGGGEDPPECGNGIVEGDEECDGGSGCTGSCELEDEGGGGGPSCGDGNVDWNEECDDGNHWDNDGCSGICTQEGGGGGSSCGWQLGAAYCDDLCYPEGFYYGVDANCNGTGDSTECTEEYGPCYWQQMESTEGAVPAVAALQLSALAGLLIARPRRRRHLVE